VTAGKPVLITGANGFIGRALCVTLKEHGYPVHAAIRKERNASHIPEGVFPKVIGNIDGTTQWDHVLEGMDVVVHLAARVHIMQEQSRAPIGLYREVNTLGTEHLASAAAAAGVRRFVYVSTIKVNCESTSDHPFLETDVPQPSDPYGISKWEAEQRLQEIASGSGLELVIVRPPLVYGPGVRGNFQSLMRLVERGLPLPLAGCRNRRSLVGLSNFVDLLFRCISHPDAKGQVFLASDGEDLSTPELIRRLAKALGVHARLFPMPDLFLHLVARAVGRKGVYERLCGSLQVDMGHAQRVLGWTPPLTIDQELARTAMWYQHRHQAQ